MNPVEHVIYKLRNAKINHYPYPHFFVENVFPLDFYSNLLNALPEDDSYEPFAGGYKSRTALKGELIQDGAMDRMVPFNSEYFASNVLGLWGGKLFFERFQGSPNFRWDLRFIRDSEGYSIGPHTDAPFKVVSLLFYLPRSFSNVDYGTGIYVPDDHKKTCEGGPHYKFDGFSEVWRAPFSPNSCFGFWKTPNSWHAVAKISRKIRRDVFLYNIYSDS